MTSPAGLLTYYRARAPEYERVYDKPERQPDLARLHAIIPEAFAHRRVLEVACGTGYWTRRIAPSARAVTGCDLAPEALDYARQHQPVAHPATFVVANAFDLGAIPGEFDAGFGGFWWSHVLQSDLARFLRGFHERLNPESRVVIVDNRYVEGSSQPISRVDSHGNSYQRRQLLDGSEHEVLKNFPSPAAVCDVIAGAGGRDVSVQELEYYWYATYRL